MDEGGFSPTAAHVSGAFFGVATGTLVFLGLSGNPNPYAVAVNVLVVVGAFLAYRVLAGASRVRGIPAALGGLLAGFALPVFYTSGLDEVWKAPPDRPATVRAVGSWLNEGLVIRVRQDSAIAYRTADGTVQWSRTPPGRQTVCAMSDTVSEGVGLIGHADTGRACTRVTALDLATGVPLWTARIRGEKSRSGDDAASGRISTAGSVAIVREPDRVRAFGLRTGKARWLRRTSCTTVEVTGGTVPALIEECGKEVWVRALRAKDGVPEVQAKLPLQGRPQILHTLSARPLLVRVKEKGLRGTDAVISYDPEGRRLATIPVDGRQYALAIDGGTAFRARPERAWTIIEDHLIVPVVRPGDTRVRTNRSIVNRHTDGRVAAFSLTDGRRAWLTEFDGKVLGVAPHGSSVALVTDDDSLITIDARSGELASDEYVPGDEASPVDLWFAGDRWIIVEGDGTGEHPPVRALKGP